MMITHKNVEAVYEGGVFRPVRPIDLPDHQMVEISISVKGHVQLVPEVMDMIALLKEPLPVLSPEDIARISEPDVD